MLHFNVNVMKQHLKKDLFSCTFIQMEQVLYLHIWVTAKTLFYKILVISSMKLERHCFQCSGSLVTCLYWKLLMEMFNYFILYITMAVFWHLLFCHIIFLLFLYLSRSHMIIWKIKKIILTRNERFKIIL